MGEESRNICDIRGQWCNSSNSSGSVKYCPWLRSLPLLNSWTANSVGMSLTLSLSHISQGCLKRLLRWDVSHNLEFRSAFVDKDEHGLQPATQRRNINYILPQSIAIWYCNLHSNRQPSTLHCYKVTASQRRRDENDKDLPGCPIWLYEGKIIW